MRVGSLCTGYGGLDLAVGGELQFVSEIDGHACTVLERRFPGVPNLGDFTTLDTLPDCDVLTGGFPCQPVSQAGKRKGTDDERWLWDDIERVLGNMGRPPGVVFLENVRGLLTANGGDAMARVVSGLARLGYVGSYRLVRASDVGACHRRERVFIVAWHTEGGRRDGSDSGAAAAADGQRLERRQEQHCQSDGGEPENPSGGHADRPDLFGPYWPAVARWERIIGRPAPPPTHTYGTRRRQVTGSVRNNETQPAGRTTEHDHQPVSAGEKQDEPGPARLNPRFVEWMMGLPAGWVTDTGIPHTAQLKILGNGVVPQQARHAWEMST